MTTTASQRRSSGRAPRSRRRRSYDRRPATARASAPAPATMSASAPAPPPAPVSAHSSVPASDSAPAPAAASAAAFAPAPAPAPASPLAPASEPIPAPAAAPQFPVEPFERHPFERPQHSFLSDPSRVTSKLFEALVNSRVGVCDAHIHTKDLVVPVSRSVLAALNSFLADYACPAALNPPPPPHPHPAPAHARPLPILAEHLRHVLEFIYTNDCAFVRNVRSSVLWRKDNDVSPSVIVQIIHLANAAHLCHTPELSTWCENTAMAIVRHRPNLLCSALKTIINCPTSNAQRLIDLWMSRVFQQPAYFLGSVCTLNSPLQLNPTTADLRTPIVDLDANTLSTILKARQDNDEYYFRALYCWATRGYTEFVRAGARWRNAVKLVSRIDLTKVSSKFLLGFVDSSGLIPEQDMPVIIRKHLAAKSNLPQSYGMQCAKDKPKKRTAAASDHHTHSPQKKQRLEQGTGSGHGSSPVAQSQQPHASLRAPSTAASLHNTPPPPSLPLSTPPHHTPNHPPSMRPHHLPTPFSSTRTFSIVTRAGERAQLAPHSTPQAPSTPATSSRHTQQLQATPQQGAPPPHQPQPAPVPNYFPGTAVHHDPTADAAHAMRSEQTPTSALGQSDDDFIAVKKELIEELKPKVKEESEIIQV